MKRFLILILGLVLGVQAFGQNGIYTKVRYLDKFDDCVKEETIKTIVEKTDSTFIIETKGKKAQEYRIIIPAFLDTAGSEDDIVNLFDDVYGYQEAWCVMKAEDYKKWVDVGTIPAGEFLLTIIHRVIKTQYTHSHVAEFFWVQDDTNTKLGKDINRIIYKK